MDHLSRLETSFWEGYGYVAFFEGWVRFNDEMEEFLERHKLFG